MRTADPTPDVLVVGGGLAGLTAAAFAGRAGARVTLLEQAARLGGRADTRELSGFRFNLGPHALYAKGAAAAVLDELGIEVSGGVPPTETAVALDGTVLRTLPAGLMSLLVTSLVGPVGKIQLARWLAMLQKTREDASLDDVAVDAWLDRWLGDPRARRLAEALVRVSSYTNAPARMSAGAALTQLHRAFNGGVRYLDNGWRSIVTKLADAASAAGADIVTGRHVVSIRSAGPLIRATLSDGATMEAAAAIVAGPPETAASIIGGSSGAAIARWAEAAGPVKLACFDVGLIRLPNPRRTFALGIDSPLYLSVHTVAARLAPEGAVLIHTAKYLGDEPHGDVRQELEALLDLVQPGWRELVVVQQFLPSMTVAGGTITAASGGMRGRPGPALPDLPNVFLAGDWVGSEGMLGDASAASGKAAAELAIRARAGVVAA